MTDDIEHGWLATPSQSFNYSDDDGVLRYKDEQGNDATITAGEGFVFRFNITEDGIFQ